MKGVSSGDCGWSCLLCSSALSLSSESACAAHCWFCKWSLKASWVLLQDWDLASQGIARNTWSVSRPTADIEYVDDTLLIARTTTQLLAILHSLERHALQHRMNLNIWEKPLESAFRHRAALAETAYKKLRLVWNSNLPRRTNLRIFQPTFIPTLIFGLDTLTLADKQVARVDAYYFRFLRRIVNIKASYYSRSTNNVVWRTANYPRKPSSFIHNAQHKLLVALFHSTIDDPFHNVVFSSAYKDRIIVTGRRRGMKVPYWIEITTQRHYPNHWKQNPGKGILGPHQVYATINRDLKSSFERAPKRADEKRAGP